MNWLRTSNLSKQLCWFGKVLEQRHEVIYQNIANFQALTNIQIEINHNILTMRLEIPSWYYDRVCDIWRTVFPSSTEDFHTWPHGATIYPAHYTRYPQQFVQCFSKFSTSLNTSFDYEVIPPILCNEVQAIFSCLPNGITDKFKHLIPERDITYKPFPRAQPPKTSSSIGRHVSMIKKAEEIEKMQRDVAELKDKELFPDLSWQKINFAQEIEDLHALLLSGADPNDNSDDKFSSPLKDAINIRNRTIFAWLLDYHADPFKRNLLDNRRESVIEYAFLHAHTSELCKDALIQICRMYMTSKVKATLGAIHQKQADLLLDGKTEEVGLEFFRLACKAMQGESKHASFNNNATQPKFNMEFISLIDFRMNHDLVLSNGKTITSCIQPADLLHQKENEHIYKCLYDLFVASFRLDNPEAGNMQEEFDLGLKGRLIKIITDKANHQPIGFIIFSFKPLKNNDKEYHFVEFHYSALSSTYRHNNFMLLFMFSIPYALQWMLYSKVVGASYTALHYNSYRWIEGQKFTAFPHFRSEGILRLFEKLTNVKFIQDGMKLYVDDGMEVNAPLLTSKITATKASLFYHGIMGLPSPNSTLGRGVPVMFFAGQENFHSFEDACRSLGINLQEYIIDLAESLRPLINQYVDEHDRLMRLESNTFLPNRNDHFWEEDVYKPTSRCNL